MELNKQIERKHAVGSNDFHPCVPMLFVIAFRCAVTTAVMFAFALVLTLVEGGWA